MHQRSLTTMRYTRGNLLRRSTWEKSKGLGCRLHTARDLRVFRRQLNVFRRTPNETDLYTSPYQVRGKDPVKEVYSTRIYVLTSLKSAFLQSCPAYVRCSRQKTPLQPLQVNGRKSVWQKGWKSRASRQLGSGSRIGVPSSNLATEVADYTGGRSTSGQGLNLRPNDGDERQ